MSGAAIVLLAFLVPAQEPPVPPPLAEAQRRAVSKLAADTKAETERLKAALEDRQRELTRVYGEYALDETKATELEAEILDLQGQMLASYRSMQVELRKLVGRERFMILKKRLDNAVRSQGKPR